MAEKENKEEPAYRDERTTDPNRETGNINNRNNNVAVSTPGAEEPTVEGANNTGIGDAGRNDERLTRHTSNHSADA